MAKENGEGSENAKKTSATGRSEPQYHVVLMKDWEKQMSGSVYRKLSPELSLAARAERRIAV